MRNQLIIFKMEPVASNVILKRCRGQEDERETAKENEDWAPE